MRNVNHSLIEGNRNPETVAERIAARAAKLLRELRGRYSLRMTAELVDMHHTWVQRAERGEFILTSYEDWMTYAEALEDDPERVAEQWGLILDEENQGVCPWDERIILPGTYRRQGAEEERKRSEAKSWDGKKIAGLDAGALARMLQDNVVVLAGLKAMCDEHEYIQTSGD